MSGTPLVDLFFLNESGLTTRAYCALKRAGFTTVEQLIELRHECDVEDPVHQHCFMEKMRDIRNVGWKTYEVIESALDAWEEKNR